MSSNDQNESPWLSAQVKRSAHEHQRGSNVFASAPEALFTVWSWDLAVSRGFNHCRVVQPFFGMIIQSNPKCSCCPGEVEPTSFHLRCPSIPFTPVHFNHSNCHSKWNMDLAKRGHKASISEVTPARARVMQLHEDAAFSAVLYAGWTCWPCVSRRSCIQQLFTWVLHYFTNDFLETYQSIRKIIWHHINKSILFQRHTSTNFTVISVNSKSCRPGEFCY